MRTRRSVLATTVVALGVAVLVSAAPALGLGLRDGPGSVTPKVRMQLGAKAPAAKVARSAGGRHEEPVVPAQLEPCDLAGPDGLCGTVPVPLDRSNPSRGTIPIFFLFYPSRSSEDAKEAILVTGGGPGFSLIHEPGALQYFRDTFEPLRDQRALIFLDQRGVGGSGAIDCPQIQHGTDDPFRDIAACGEQLGRDASLYTTGEVALDIEAVRRALGIKKFDFYGGSYAAVDIQAYATRFPKRLRSAVLDSPATVLPYDFEAPTVRALNRTVQLICARSASCSADHDDALEDVAALARRLRRDPVEGVGLDSLGQPHQVSVTESFLLWRILLSDAGFYASVSEIAAAGDALRHGDAVPLLRLAAEGDGPLLIDEGDPIVFSAGHNNARYCSDQPMPWDKDDAFDERLDDWQDARDALPRDEFAPFSVDGWLAPPPLGPLGPDLCIAWPAPRPRGAPPLPRGLKFSRKVPALFLSGDLDFNTSTEEALRVARAWPRSRFVEVVNSGHQTIVDGRFDCASSIVVGFIADLRPGDTACAKDTRFGGIPAVGRFPRKAAGARQALRAAGDDSTKLDRRVVTVATATVTDAFRRTFLTFPPAPGPGLRGGSYAFDLDPEGTMLTGRLEGARFSGDVAVTGNASYLFETESIDATVQVDGPGDSDGALQIRGAWAGVTHEVSVLEVTGQLGGRQLVLRVPAT
jgi:pimeloyl-ACP methyl ester carboxylesterase